MVELSGRLVQGLHDVFGDAAPRTLHDFSHARDGDGGDDADHGDGGNDLDEGEGGGVLLSALEHGGCGPGGGAQ
jgi:hypothetical protein